MPKGLCHDNISSFPTLKRPACSLIDKGLSMKAVGEVYPSKGVGEVYPSKGVGEVRGAESDKVLVIRCRLGESSKHGRDTSEQFPPLFDGHDLFAADAAGKIEKGR